MAKKVIDTVTGIIYGSVKEAPIDSEIHYDTLKSLLKGKRKNKTNIKYYIDE